MVREKYTRTILSVSFVIIEIFRKNIKMHRIKSSILYFRFEQSNVEQPNYELRVFLFCLAVFKVKLLVLLCHSSFLVRYSIIAVLTNVSGQERHLNKDRVRIYSRFTGPTATR
jgi:hypothetical protein